MYVILLKDKYNGLYLCEQFEYYLDRETAINRCKEYEAANRDTIYHVIKVELNPESYTEYKQHTHNIIYEGALYNDIDRCIFEGDYNNV